MENAEKIKYIDIHKMSETFFDTYLFDMPRWAQSIYNCVMTHGDQCDIIDCLAFFHKMYEITGLSGYDQLAEEYEKVNPWSK